MAKPSLRDAIAWLVSNDDCSWLTDERPIPSVPAALVIDLYRVDSTALVRKMRTAILRENGTDPRGFPNGAVR